MQAYGGKLSAASHSCLELSRAYPVRFLCDFRAISARYQLTLYEKIACDVKPKLTIYVLSLYGPIVERDLCAYTIRVKYSGSQLPTLARQISNRSFKNKPKTSPIFFYDLLSSILFIISYLLPINEPHIYSLKYIWVILWKCPFFLAFTEILHLKNTWLQFFLYIF